MIMVIADISETCTLRMKEMRLWLQLTFLLFQNFLCLSQTM